MAPLPATAGKRHARDMRHQDIKSQDVHQHDPSDYDWEHAYTGQASDLEPPDALILQTIEALAPGRSLDVGCGAGGLVVELASRGWRASGIDLAEGAIRSSRAALAERGLTATVEVADASHWRPGHPYDLVTCAFALPGTAEAQARALSMMRQAVAPGGHVILKDFDPGMQQVQPVFAAWHMLDIDEVRRAFDGFEVLAAEVVSTPPHDHDGSGAHAGEHWTAAFFHARRPADAK